MCLQAWVLNKIQTHRPTLIALIQKALDMVHRDQFQESLATLGLVDSSGQGASQGEPAAGKPTTKYAQVWYSYISCI